RKGLNGLRLQDPAAAHQPHQYQHPYKYPPYHLIPFLFNGQPLTRKTTTARRGSGPALRHQVSLIHSDSLLTDGSPSASRIVCLLLVLTPAACQWQSRPTSAGDLRPLSAEERQQQQALAGPLSAEYYQFALEQSPVLRSQLGLRGQ